MARVTVSDVARDASVSRSTVSLVLRDSPLVADSTRAKVRASMARLGYVYNRGAASLRTRRSHTVGLIVTDVSNPFYAEFTVGAQATLAAAGVTVLLGHNFESADVQTSLISVMQEYGVDGLLLTPAHTTTAAALKPLIAAQLPHVLVTRYVRGHQANYVGADNVGGARAVTEHVLSHEAKRIAFLGGPPSSSSRRDRLVGVKQALAAADIRLSARMSPPSAVSRKGGYDAALELLDRKPVPHAIVCHSDIVAFGVLLACDIKGLTVGKDIIVTGFDNIEDSGLQRPPLTTVGVDPRGLGQRAAQLLLEQIATPTSPVVDYTGQSPLIIRSSCGCHHGD
jgi:LacI family transcriptional regulator